MPHPQIKIVGETSDGTIRAIAVAEDGSILTKGGEFSPSPSLTIYPHTDTFTINSNGLNDYPVNAIARVTFQIINGSDISYRYLNTDGVATKAFYPLPIGQEESEDFGSYRFSGRIQFRNMSASNAEIALKTWGDIDSYGLE